MQKVVTLRGIESKKLQYLGCMSCMHVYTTLIYYNSLESAICNKINNDYSQLVVRTQKVKRYTIIATSIYIAACNSSIWSISSWLEHK